LKKGGPNKTLQATRQNRAPELHVRAACGAANGGEMSPTIERFAPQASRTTQWSGQFLQNITNLAPLVRDIP